MGPEGHQQRGDVGERGGQQQEESGLGAEPRAVATLGRIGEELVQRHERRAAAPSLHGNRWRADEPITSTQDFRRGGASGRLYWIR